jgi:hypothetical protein
MDPDVWRLYQDLLNKKYEDIDDFLTSSPVEEENRKVTNNKIESHNPNIHFEAGLMDLSDDIDYGL